MSALQPEGPRAGANRQALIWKTAFVVLGLIALAASLVGVWLSSGPPATAVMPSPQASAPAERQFKFVPYSSPRAVANVEFEDGNNQKRSLTDFRGKVVLLNIWATWCGPCRKEMPTLDRLQAKLGSADFEVVALSIDRGGQAVVKSFFDEIDVQHLAVYVDASAQAGDSLSILGIPTTLLLDREGREIGRVVGPAQWDRPEVLDTIRRYLPRPT
ncbi:MAG TPA: TlpA disulfide reductase family protein [Casimicrobiaceae bacterium]